MTFYTIPDDYNPEDNDLPDIEIDQAIVDLAHCGAFEYRAWYGLLRREYIDAADSWFKPVPWAMSWADLNEAGQERLLAIEIEDLERPESQRLKGRKLFDPSRIGPAFTGHLVFGSGHIKNIIADGHYRELARTCHGQFWPKDHETAKQEYPDIFPVEATNV